ncbi:hypothetical protein [uncultured phage cr50_1]|jgi:hypothetical protein|uniref:Uncharacterized protein n=1 Tax=uncultured phage cr50_1 TaxID=2772059 RepID=A0A7M1RV62_9CAUD|nr:hypothetical protein KNV26_gp037 [uncultured phage cr50_1]QOR58014.1 hypothetical protein [uncultured phage cr50_1]
MYDDEEYEFYEAVEDVIDSLWENELEEIDEEFDY